MCLKGPIMGLFYFETIMCPGTFSDYFLYLVGHFLTIR